MPKVKKVKLSEGMLADVVMLNQNIFKLDIEAVKDMQVDLTSFDGEIVYETENQ